MPRQTLSVPMPRPRHPFAVAALRREALRDVQRELDRLKPPHD